MAFVDEHRERHGVESICGALRGKVQRTTVSDPTAPCPLDWVNRVFKAERPNQLWVSDFTVRLDRQLSAQATPA